MLQPPTPARESIAWTHSPPQPLMQSPLSRSLTPATPRRAAGFFGSWCPTGCPAGLIAQPTSDWQLVWEPILSAVDGSKVKFQRAGCQCPFLVQIALGFIAPSGVQCCEIPAPLLEIYDGGLDCRRPAFSTVCGKPVANCEPNNSLDVWRLLIHLVLRRH